MCEVKSKSEKRSKTKTGPDKALSLTHASPSFFALPACLWCGDQSDEMHPDKGLDASDSRVFLCLVNGPWSTAAAITNLPTANQRQGRLILHRKFIHFVKKNKDLFVYTFSLHLGVVESLFEYRRHF